MKTLRTILLAATTLALPAVSQTFSAAPLQNPAGPGSLEPNLSVTPEGSVVLSWIAPSKNGSSALLYAVRHGSTWSQPHTIAANRHFFRHPAEVPEVMATAGGHWLAHWVELPDPSSDAEYVYVSSSADGVKWTPPVQAHRDHSAVQHGLVSMLPDANGGASLFFLESLKGEDGPDVPDALGGGRLRQTGQRRAAGLRCVLLLPHRGRQDRQGHGACLSRSHPEEHPRHRGVRFENGRWSTSKIIYPDNWEIDACPINAASVAAQGDHVAVSWYTAAQNSPKVRIAFSSDGGATFSKPVTVSTGQAYGYTSIVMSGDGKAIVSWLEHGAQGARVLVREIAPTGAPGPVAEVAKGDRSDLGYPKLVHAGSETLIAWGSKVQTAMLRGK